MPEYLRQQLEPMLLGKLTMEAVLFDPALVELILDFYSFTASWLLHLADALGGNERQTVKALSVVPEFIVEDLAAVLPFVLRLGEQDQVCGCFAFVLFSPGFVFLNLSVYRCLVFSSSFLNW
jgi:hypothetical protein